MKARLLLIASITLVAVVGLNAQNLKIGYADANYILSLMPAAKQAQADLQTHETMIQTNLQAKYKDYQTKLADYQEKAQTMDELIRKDKERELVAIQESIQQYEGEAQSSIVKKQNELLSPLFQQIGEAIKAVAEENITSFLFGVSQQLF